MGVFTETFGDVQVLSSPNGTFIMSLIPTDTPCRNQFLYLIYLKITLPIIYNAFASFYVFRLAILNNVGLT